MPLMKFRLKETHRGVRVGPHFPNTQADEEGRMFPKKPGDIIESEKDLSVVFPNKYERVDEKQATPSVPPSSDEPASPPHEGAIPHDAGEDVSEQFSQAEEAMVRVFKVDQHHYNVTERDAPSRLLNEAPLKKAEVNKLIKSMVKEE